MATLITHSLFQGVEYACHRGRGGAAHDCHDASISDETMAACPTTTAGKPSPCATAFADSTTFAVTLALRSCELLNDHEFTFALQA